MTDILKALAALNRSLENLESAAHEKKRKIANQRDLFGGMSGSALLAKKLDVAIERVQQVLREG